MSGNPSSSVDEPDVQSVDTEVVMFLFNVDEKTAKEIINWCVSKTELRMHKWVDNYRRLQKNKVDEILRYIHNAKRGHKSGLDNAEKLLLEMCIEQCSL
jgi:hypothetical protein